MDRRKFLGVASVAPLIPFIPLKVVFPPEEEFRPKPIDSPVQLYVVTTRGERIPLGIRVLDICGDEVKLEAGLQHDRPVNIIRLDSVITHKDKRFTTTKKHEMAMIGFVPKNMQLTFKYTLKGWA